MAKSPALIKATVNIEEYASTRSIILEEETTYFTIQGTGYGIIVIDDTLKMAEGTLIGAYASGQLTLVLNNHLMDLKVGFAEKPIELGADVLILKSKTESPKSLMIEVYLPALPKLVQNPTLIRNPKP